MKRILDTWSTVEDRLLPSSLTLRKYLVQLKRINITISLLQHEQHERGCQN